MKTFIALLFLTASVFGQYSYLPDTTDSRLIAYYIYDGNSFTITNDYSPNAETLTANGGVGDSSLANSPIISGGHSTYFVTDDFFSRTSANFAELNFGTSNISFFGWIKNTNTGAFEWVISKYTSYGGANNGFDIGYDNTNNFIFGINAGSGQKIVTKSGKRDGEWHWFGAVRNGDNVQLTVDGDAFVTATGASAYNVTNAFDVKIGERSSDGNFNWTGFMSMLSIYGEALTLAELRDLAMLPAGYRSLNGNVSRAFDNFTEFTMWDTVGIPLTTQSALGATQEWRVTVRAKSSDATKTVRAFIGSIANPKTSTQSTTAQQEYTNLIFNLGNGITITSADTLWVMSNSLSDSLTISVDSGLISKVKNHLLINPAKTRTNWLSN